MKHFPIHIIKFVLLCYQNQTLKEKKKREGKRRREGGTKGRREEGGKEGR